MIDDIYERETYSKENNCVWLILDELEKASFIDTINHFWSSWVILDTYHEIESVDANR